MTRDTVRLLTLSTEPWLSCEDCFELMDGYIEALLADPGSTESPGMRVHLTGCGACAEETESLLLLVAGQDGVDPGPALQRLHDHTDNSCRRPQGALGSRSVAVDRPGR